MLAVIYVNNNGNVRKDHSADLEFLQLYVVWNGAKKQNEPLNRKKGGNAGPQPCFLLF